MTHPASIAEQYIAIWNDTDPESRRARIAGTWAEDASYVDPLMRGRGHAQIDALVAAVHARFPGFVFALAGQPDGHGKHLRFSWELGPQGGASLVKGTDFAVLDGDRLKTVIGFLDQVPAGA